MTLKYLSLALLCLVVVQPLTIIAQDQAPDDKAELTDGAQTLEAHSTTSSEDNEASVPAPSAKKNNNPIVSEEELLKPAPKKEEGKVKADKINESEIYIQEAEKYKATEFYKNLKLNDVIEQGLRKNYDQTIRDKKAQINELDLSGIKRAFWVPELKLTLTTADQRISRFNSGSTSPNPTVPNGAFGLQMANYTVFNWGKDYALYLNNKATYERNQKVFEENRREFRLDLITQFFTLMTLKNIEKITQEQLKQSSFVYRLNKEKITIAKVSKQDYYMSRSEYLRSQGEYRTAKLAADLQDENMSYTLADEIGTKYVLTENLSYKPIRISLEECILLATNNNPGILNSKTSLENADRSYDVALKENLPLPKFSINLGAYSKKFGPTTNKTTYDNYSTGGNTELVASINASWSLTGTDGLFNSDKVAKNWMNKELSLRDLEKNNHLAKSLLRQTYSNILSYQGQILIQEARIPSLQKSFDTVLDNYLNGKTKYSDFHITLSELTQAKIQLEETKLLHLREKLALAKYAGVENFPGENFDTTAVSAQEKK